MIIAAQALKKPPVLVVVMPVYNEEASVSRVIHEWFAECEKYVVDFVYLALNDGSKDNTLCILQDLQKTLGPRLQIISRPNRGHGQSCLEGYRWAVEHKAQWIFQIDSDGQCDPCFFKDFWAQRNDYEVVSGWRTKRYDGAQRMLASLVLRFYLFILFHSTSKDANVPYRLYRTEAVAHHFERIPASFDLVNIAVSVLLKKDPQLRTKDIKIHFNERYGGTASVTFMCFAVKAAQLYKQLADIMHASKKSAPVQAALQEDTEASGR